MALQRVKRGDLISSASMNELLARAERVGAVLSALEAAHQDPAKGDLLTRLQKLEARFVALEHASAAVNDLSGKAQSVEARLAALKDTSDRKGALVAQLSTKAEGLGTRLPSLQGGANGQHAALNELSGTVESLEKRFAALKGTITGRGAAVTALQGSLQDLASKVAELEKVVGARPGGPILASPVDIRVDEMQVDIRDDGSVLIGYSLRSRNFELATYTIHPSVTGFPDAMFRVLDDARQALEERSIRLDGRTPASSQKTFYVKIENATDGMLGAPLQVDVKQGGSVVDRLSCTLQQVPEGWFDTGVWVAPLSFEAVDAEGAPALSPLHYDKATSTLKLPAGGIGRMRFLLTVYPNASGLYRCSLGLHEPMGWEAAFSSGPCIATSGTSSFTIEVPSELPFRVDQTYAFDVQASLLGSTAQLTLELIRESNHFGRSRSFNLVAT